VVGIGVGGLGFINVVVLGFVMVLILWLIRYKFLCGDCACCNCFLYFCFKILVLYFWFMSVGFVICCFVFWLFNLLFLLCCF